MPEVNSDACKSDDFARGKYSIGTIWETLHRCCVMGRFYVKKLLPEEGSTFSGLCTMESLEKQLFGLY